MEFIKVNLPASEFDYINGYGEGVFMIVTDEVKAAYDRDEDGTTYDGILDNDSIYYKGLYHGEVLPLEMRGQLRPVVPYNWLRSNFELSDDI